MLKNILHEQDMQGKAGITFAQLKNAGFSATGVSRAVRRGELLRVAHGLYQTRDFYVHMDDELFATQLKYRHIVYSHDTALYLHGLNDRDPLRYSVTVPTGYNTKRLITDGFKVFSLKEELYSQDIVDAVTMHGNTVKGTSKYSKSSDSLDFFRLARRRIESYTERMTIDDNDARRKKASESGGVWVFRGALNLL